jgi:hypothetical protein
MKELIHEYAQGYELLRASIDGLSEEQMRFRPAPGKWSIHEIIVHVTDSEIVGLHRFKKVLAEDRPLLTAFDQDKWAAQLRYHELDAGQYLLLFKFLRESFLPVLSRLTEDDWQRGGHSLGSRPHDICPAAAKVRRPHPRSPQADRAGQSGDELTDPMSKPDGSRYLLLAKKTRLLSV